MYNTVGNSLHPNANTCQCEIKSATNASREQLTVFENIVKFGECRDGTGVTHDTLVQELDGATKDLEKLLESVEAAKEAS